MLKKTLTKVVACTLSVMLACPFSTQALATDGSQEQAGNNVGQSEQETYQAVATTNEQAQSEGAQAQSAGQGQDEQQAEQSSGVKSSEGAQALVATATNDDNAQALEAVKVALEQANASDTANLAEQKTTLDATATTDVTWYTKDTSATVFYINDAASLRGLSAIVNGTATDEKNSKLPAFDFKGRIIIQSANINLGLQSAGGNTVTASEFEPIGTKDHPFAGTYTVQKNGSSFYTVSNLCITSKTSNTGMFGYCSSTAIIQGLTLQKDQVGCVKVETATELVRNVGSAVGYTEGMVIDCWSDMPVSVNSTGKTLSTVDEQYVVRFVGGLIGYSQGKDVSGTSGACAIDRCGFMGSLNVEIASDAPDTGSDQSEGLRVGDSFGGVVGRFGTADVYGTINESYNEGSVTTKTTGAGSADRFGTTTYANVFFVGGVCGYSNGSITNCHNGTYDPLNKTTTGNVFTAVERANGTLQGNRGADQTGGICGGLRSVTEQDDKYNDGDPALDIKITDCHNEGQVRGLVATGGIAGEVGTAVLITRCYNGTVSDPTDWTANQTAGKVTTTRWNKPISGGICGKTYSGVISYCANYAEVRNTQTGYYMAGICGAIFSSDDHPEVTGEIYACLNTGGIYTANTDKAQEYREAGICGQNEGDVHDCLMLEGCVPYHSDSVIGANDMGIHSNLEVRSATELQSGESAAFLNSLNAQNQTWDTYWFINSAGYPMLNTWANLTDDQRIELSASSIESVEQLSPAPYAGEGQSPIPTLKVTLKSGKVLVQNTDFFVTPQTGASAMTDSLTYKASITGIGLYRGTVADCASYSIGKGSLSNASIQVGNGKYNFGKVVFPTSIKAVAFGSEISASEYDIVIYSSLVSKATVEHGTSGSTMAYDSLGYISFDDGITKEPVSDYTFAQLNALTKDWKLYNRNQEIISDSAGNIYYATGNGGVVGAIYSGKNSFTKMTSQTTPAGYLVQATAKSSSTVLEGEAFGYYSIDTLSLYTECTFEKMSFGNNEWLWDNDTSSFYTETGGKKTYGRPQITFTGEPITPNPVVTYNGRTLVEGSDFSIISGDPNPASSNEGKVTPQNNNRDVTDYNSETSPVRAAITVQPVDKNCYSNYFISYFEITPAKFSDCDISVAADEWAYTGNAIEPEVTVSLNGVKLEKGTDYTVEYENNTDKGTATYKVTPLANLGAGDQTPRTGTFKITDGTSLTDYTLDSIADQQYNYGYDVNPTLTFKNGSGTKMNLEKGKDYTVSYSTTDVTKSSGYNPDGSSIKPASTTPCTVTVTGIGKYTGTLTQTFHIVPYDASTNSTNQLKVVTQDMYWGQWGAHKNQDGAATPPYNMGVECPVVQVYAYPIVDWDAHAKDSSQGYGSGILLSHTSGGTYNTYGGLTNTYPVKYYNESGDLISFDGQAYKSADGTQLSPRKATIGNVYATVLFCTNSKGNGATGELKLTEPIQYMSGTDISKYVKWTLESSKSPTYDGTSKTPVVGYTKGAGFDLVEGQDYTITYSNNVEAGKASYTVTAKTGSMYTGTYSGEFSILPANLENATLNPISAQRYTGSAVEPSVVVNFNGKTLVQGTDYTLSYLNNQAVGTGTVYIRGCGNYTGQMSAEFKIVDGENPCATGHTWGDWVITRQPTNIANGMKQRTCSVCSATESEAIPMLEASIKRLSGHQAYETSSKIAVEAFESCEWAIVARDDDFADAMSATGLAGVYDAPIVLTNRNELSDDTATTLKQLGVKNVYIIGGSGAVTKNMEEQLRTRAEITGTIERVSGHESYDTSVECAKKIAAKKKALGQACDKAIIAYGQNFQDALSISSFAYAYGVPIFLETYGERSADRWLSNDAKAMLTTGDFATADVFVPGGSGAVSRESVEGVLGESRVGNRRLSEGENGYDTSNYIAKWMTTNGPGDGTTYLSAQTTCVASGALAPKGVDALAGAALAGKNKGVMLLTNYNTNYEARNKTTIDDFLTNNKTLVENAYILGGSAVTPPSVYDAVKELIGA